MALPHDDEPPLANRTDRRRSGGLLAGRTAVERWPPSRSRGDPLGRPVAAHGGAVYGFENFLLCLPDQDIAVAVISNAFPGPVAGHPQLIATAIAKAAFPAP
jgi:hypothetical protein